MRELIKHTLASSKPMAPKQSEYEWKSYVKAIFILVCCTYGGATISDFGIDKNTSSVLISSFIAKLGTVLLTVLLICSLRLGMHGRRSESWAVLAYGSWMVAACAMFAYIVWDSLIHVGMPWYGILTQGAILAFLMTNGMKSALQGQCFKLAVWWFGSAFLTFLLAFQYNELREYAEQIQQSAIVTPAAQPSPLPKAPSGKQITIL